MKQPIMGMINIEAKKKLGLVTAAVRGKDANAKFADTVLLRLGFHLLPVVCFKK